ncbi:MAG: hypothetical protein EOM72_06960 [Opitutae bacterium]|nr:hypothetical protein [Opitutae bacterium]
MKRLLAFSIFGVSLSACTWGASISGTVTDSTGTTPLEGIDVTAYQDDGFWWSHVQSASTDSDGHYTIENLDGGTYRVGFWDVNKNYAEEYYDDAPDVDAATDIVLGASQDLTGVDAQLEPASSISGMVTGPDGSPLNGIGVQKYSWNGWIWNSSDGHTTRTEADGSYALKGLTGGTYRLKFQGMPHGYVSQFHGGSYDVNMAANIEVPDDSSIRGIDAMLAEGGHISGFVSGPAGSPPLDEYTVYAYRRKGAAWTEFGGWTWIGFGGAFDYTGLPPGTYRLWIQGPDADNSLLGEYYDDTNDFDQAQDLVLAPGATIGNVDVELALAGHITGALVDSGGNPVAEADIVAHQFLNGAWNIRTYTNADATGAFNLAGLAPGAYRVMFLPWSSALASQWFSNSATLASARDIVLGPAATVSNVNARIGAASHITGTVTGPGGIPIAMVEAQAVRLDAGEWRLVDTGVTDDSGVYNIGGLPAGTYRLLFWPHEGNYAPEYYNNALHVSNALDVVVSGTTTVSGIHVSLVAGARLSGTVTGLGGSTPLPGIDVRGHWFDGSQWTELWGATTDETGHYAFEGLPVGQIRLHFSDFYDTCVPEWYDNAPDESSAQAVVVASAGQVLTGYNASLAIASPPAPPSPEFLDIQWTDPASWTLKFLGELDVDYRLQRMRPVSNDWVDTGSIAIGSGPTNEIPLVDEAPRGLFRMRVVR